jgi:hypothetical protein
VYNAVTCAGKLCYAYSYPKRASVARHQQTPPPVEVAKQEDMASALQNLLNAERSLIRAKEQILTTWVHYQTARLDLYGRLGIRR